MSVIYSEGSWRVRPGTWDVDDMTDAYEWSAFPQQTDQPDFLRWLQPVDPSGAINEVVELVDALDGSRGGIGSYNGQLIFAPMTAGMIRYVRSYVFGGAFNADVTLMVWSRSEGWLVLNCKAQWNEPAQSSQPGGKQGYLDFKINFITTTTGGIANLGNALTAEDESQLLLETGDFLLYEG